MMVGSTGFYLETVTWKQVDIVLQHLETLNMDQWMMHFT
jgi:hypothetical protein